MLGPNATSVCVRPRYAFDVVYQIVVGAKDSDIVGLRLNSDTTHFTKAQGIIYVSLSMSFPSYLRLVSYFAEWLNRKGLNIPVTAVVSPRTTCLDADVHCLL